MSLVEGTKKRRLRGACDICRRQKIRCDSAKMPGNRCSNCISFNSECTHNLSQLKEDKQPRRKRTTTQESVAPANETAADDSVRVPKTAKGIVDGLLGGTYQAPQDHETLLQLLLEISRFAKSLQGELDAYRQSQSPSDRASSTAVSSPSNDVDADDDPGIVIDRQKLPEHLKRVTSYAADHRFFGKNSSIMFVKTAIETQRGHSIEALPVRSMRPHYCNPLPWELSQEPPSGRTFPPDDLLRDLVEIFFTQINIYSFILHRPTFEKSIADGLHLRNHQFGAIVLAVCALASKNSSDKRVLLPVAHAELSAGYIFFRQIPPPFSGHAAETTTLYDLQLCCLYIMFLHTSSTSESTWLLCGIGILHAHDTGAHLTFDVNQKLTAEGELSKRSFYFLNTYDAIISACFGRPRVAANTGSDPDFPLPCDDQYWEQGAPEKAFKQPPGKPSLADFSIAYIKLIRIFTFAWRKPDLSVLDYTGRKPLEPEIIAELDARFNKWAEEIPEHLLWNPYMEDDVFFDQSASLYATYYHLQILVHRPFIRTRVDQAPSSFTFRSLAVCTNAARSCSHVADVKSRRGFYPNGHTLKAVFDSAIVLLLNISGGTRSGLAIDTERELIDVYKCMTMLHQSERRWQNAGRFYDILRELMNAYNLPLPSFPPDVIPPGQWCASSNDSKDAPDALVAVDQAQNFEPWPDHLLSLPMAVEDLGRLPIYGSLESSSEMDFLDKIIPDAPTGTVHPYEMDIDMGSYLGDWILPYFSSVDEMAQAMQSGFPRN
ncbi:hypothetical protein B0H11DRAFT_1982465 [Mycena galericulata]|nr:hypothetical protein B0H11DRAFT_1982465 [Mycena galericulata]